MCMVSEHALILQVHLLRPLRNLGCRAQALLGRTRELHLRISLCNLRRSMFNMQHTMQHRRYFCALAASLHSLASMPESCRRLLTPSLIRIWQYPTSLMNSSFMYSSIW